MSVRIGQKVSVSCRASGYPEPIVTWSSLDSKAIAVVDDQLVFHQTDQSISGRYRCEASNGVGAAASKDFSIRVNGTGSLSMHSRT